MTDKIKILDYMKQKGSITTAEAFYELGCSRLSGRIYDLKRDGIAIDRRMIEVNDRDGNKTRVAEYYLVKGETNG